MSSLLPLRPYQLEGVQRLRERVGVGVARLLFVLATGGGKCLGLGTPVLLFDGRIVPVEEVRPGDLLMGPDGKPRRVRSTCRGTGQLHRIVPRRGTPWVCNDVHVLTLVHSVTGEIVDIDLPKYFAQTKTFRHVHKQFAPEGGIDFAPAEPLPIDPYFVGVWFGDGTKSLNGVAISKPDPEIAELAREVAADWGLRVRTEIASSGGCPTHHLVGDRGVAGGNRLLALMRSLFAAATTIPHRYLTASRAERQALLAGLLDSDGYLHNGSFEIVQKVRGFADGIAFVARSLGCRALISEKVVDGESYWRVSLSGDFSVLPMRIPRKKAAPRLQSKCVTRTGFDVEDIGVGEYAGFELEGDGRFLLGDFTVTHNTIVASHIVAAALEQGSTTLFVAHRREIIRQTFVKLVRNGIPISEIGIVMGDTPLAQGELFDVDPLTLSDEELWHRCARRRPSARVFVGSIDTLRVRAKLGKLDLIIIDEAHRALARSYVELVKAYPEAIVLGLTATPYRADGKGFNELFDELVVIATPRTLIDEGFLTEPEIWTAPPKSRPDLAGVKMKGGDYEIGALSAAVDRAELIGDLVEHWQRHAAGMRTVAFACTVEHSKKIAQRFRDAGVAAEHLDGETPTAERDAILGRLARGETLVVSNCAVLCEGWDMPAVKCAILARPTKSTGLYLQCAGRILRPYIDPATGEPMRAVILDHAGCWHEHGSPSDDREFSLSGDATRAKNAGGGERECPGCFRIVPLGARVCPACGEELSAGGGTVDVAEVDGRLMRAGDVQEAADFGLLAVLEADWRKKNNRRAAPLKPGWIFHRFKERTNGRRPPRGYKLPELLPEQVAKRERLEELRAEAKERGYADAWAYTTLERAEDEQVFEQAKKIGAVLDAAKAAKATALASAPAPVVPSTSAPSKPPAPWERKRPEPALPTAPTPTPAPMPRRSPWDRPAAPAVVNAPAPPADVELEEVAI